MNKKVKEIISILENYASIFDDCIDKNQFKDIAIDIHNTICTDEPKLSHSGWVAK